MQEAIPPEEKPKKGFFDFFKKRSEKGLFEKKQQLQQELDFAEQKFMKRQLSEESYNTLVKKKQQELIEVDAQISRQQQKTPEVPKEELEDVEPKQKHLFKSLLSEKQQLQSQIDLAQNKYLKRKIDEKTYKSISHKSQEKMIEIDSQLELLRNRQAAKDVFSEMKTRLNEQPSAAKSEQQEIERIAREILEQKPEEKKQLPQKQKPEKKQQPQKRKPEEKKPPKKQQRGRKR
ncbi:MAG TPA: hypothetical protein VI977_00265 [archaeon]|nr:hypothetical protein [archaeon]